MPVATRSRTNGKRPTALSELSPPEQVRRIEIPEIKVNVLKMRLVGISPLITDNGVKAIAALEKQQSGAPKEAKQPRNKEADFKSSLYLTEDGKYGVPRLALKKAVAVAAGRFTEHTKVAIAGLITVRGKEIIPLDAGKPKMRTDHAVASLKADVRYRAEFWPWAIDLTVEFISPGLTESQVAHLFRLAGRSVGIGNWRPEKGGDFGTWDLDRTVPA